MEAKWRIANDTYGDSEEREDDEVIVFVEGNNIRVRIETDNYGYVDVPGGSIFEVMIEDVFND